MTSDNKNKEELLERYVNGEELTVEEGKWIEQLFETDAPFRAEFRVRMALFEAGKQQRRAEWAAQQQQSTSKTIRFTPKPVYWMAAASIVILLSLGLWWSLNQPGSTNTMEIAVYERYENQQGIATVGAKPVDHIVLKISEAGSLSYRFSTYDTLQVFAPDLSSWKNNQWKITRFSEADYELENMAGNIKYSIEQGRDAVLPLTK